MSIEIAKRLIKLRKQNGLSQEELADKLGVSRQAVSKWETSAASPDTDNLICLAKLYNISLDELLKEEEDDEISSRPLNNDDKSKHKPEKEEVHIGLNGIHVKNTNEEVDVSWKGIHVVNEKEEVHVDKGSIREWKNNNKGYVLAQSILSGTSVILCVLAYLLFGFYTKDGWALAWPIFFIIPIVTSLINAIYYKRITNFAFPVLATGIYVTIGMCLNLWHPTWIIFLAIPLFYIISSPIDKYFGHGIEKPKEFITLIKDEDVIDNDNNK